MNSNKLHPDIAAVIHGDSEGCIVCEDCLEVMRDMPDGCVDAVVTDPPFGISWSRGTWDDSVNACPALMASLISRCQQLVAHGWCFVFQAMLNCGRFHEWFPDGWRLFAACKNFAQIRPTGVWHSWDPVVFWRNGPSSGPNSTRINRDYFVGNVAGVFRERAEHPCPKPLDTMEHIVQIASPSRGLVLDPFCGSGTTCVAAKKLGRRWIGIEIDERYCEIARNRVAKTAAPMTIDGEKRDVKGKVSFF